MAWPKNPFIQNPLCINCGSPMCQGQCQQNFQQLDNQMRKQMMAMQQMMQNPFALATELPIKTKPLPEESVICATGGLVGWRLWRVPCFGDTLLSINGAEWKPYKALRAECKQGATECRGVRCECGIYAWKNKADIERNEDVRNCVKGQVWLWGKIIEHEKGYRAEYAYPKSFEKSADGERLALIYGVKLTAHEQTDSR